MSLSLIERFFLYGKKGDYLETTKNYALNRPAQDDFYDVDDFNENMDIIDEELYALENPVYEDAKTLETLKSGEKIVTAFGKIAKAITDFISHISDEVVHITADERMKWNAKQDASTAITTGNIGNQSVKHATTADTATSANNAFQLRYFNTDWNSRVGNVYSILGSDGRVWLNASGDSGSYPASAVQYANNADTVDGCHASDFKRTSSTMDSVEAYWSDVQTKANNAFPKSGGTINGTVNLNNNGIYDSHTLQSRSTLFLRTTDKVSVENHAGNANMDIRCSYLHCVDVVKDSYRGAKENILSVSDEMAKKILDVPVRKFDYRAGFGGNKKNVLGMIVDEVQDIIPESVIIPENWNEDNFNELLGDMGNENIPCIDYTTFIPYLVDMIQIQQKEIDELKQKVTALENK